MSAYLRCGVLLLAVLLGACEGERPEPAPRSAPAPTVPEQPAPPLPAEPPVEPPAAREQAPALPETRPKAPADRSAETPAAPAEPVPSTPAPASVARPAPRPAAERPAAPPPPAVPAAPLDLSVPRELVENFQLSDPLPPAPALLPPLFAPQPETPQAFELGGRLITSERADDEDSGSWHGVEGAELQLRFRR